MRSGSDGPPAGGAQPTVNPHVIVIGGGITGLAASYELAQRGVPFVLLEASSRLGGLIKTDHVDRFIVDAGPDSVLAQKPAAIELCEELGLGSRLIATEPPRTAFVLHRGRLMPIPSPSLLGIPLTWQGLLGYDLLPPAARVRMALEPLVPRGRIDAGDESVASFFRRRFGRATIPLIAEPLLGGIHAGRVDTLSIRSLFPRLVEAERTHGSVLRAFRGSPSPPSPNGAFRSLSSGMSELVTALGRRLPPGSVRLASPAATLARDGHGWQVGTAQGTLQAARVICAAPAYAAARLLAAVDHEASNLCQGVEYVSTATVALAYARDQVSHPLAGSGYVVARGATALRTTACTWVSSKWSGRAPPGTVLLRAFIGGARDPVAVDLSDSEIVSIVVAELAELLGVAGDPLFTRVYRWRHAAAQHNVGHFARLSKLQQRLGHLPGFHVAGSGFRPVGIPDCIADGRAAAAAVADSPEIS